MVELARRLRRPDPDCRPISLSRLRPLLSNAAMSRQPAGHAKLRPSRLCSAKEARMFTFRPRPSKRTLGLLKATTRHFRFCTRLVGADHGLRWLRACTKAGRAAAKARGTRQRMRGGGIDLSDKEAWSRDVDTTKGARGPRLDKSVLAAPEPRRVRDRDHVRSVAKRPCLVCVVDAHQTRIIFASRRVKLWAAK